LANQPKCPEKIEFIFHISSKKAFLEEFVRPDIARSKKTWYAKNAW
jgi:hypothetical protein